MYYAGKKARWTLVLTGALLAAALMAVGCKQENKFQAPPPPEVTVAKPLVHDVTDYTYQTGNTQAVEAVEVRARVEGFLQSMHFKPSALVHKGDLLFIIDPRPYQAKVNQAKADLEVKKAALQLADATLIRKERAFKDHAVSEVDVIQARAEKAEAQANIEAAEAALETAQINLDYTTVRAPLTGVISRNLVDMGNLVGSGQATVLTTIRNFDSIYAYFNISETDLLYYKRSQMERKAVADDKGRAIVELAVSGDKGYPHRGYADYINNTVDPTTGTLQVRAIFDNQNRYLVPGLFVRLRVPINTTKNALLVPDSAVGADQGGRYLLVVNDKGEVDYRKVSTGDLVRGLRVIADGLKAQDRVIITGLQRARPGIKVTAKEQTLSMPPADNAKAGQDQGDQEAQPKTGKMAKPPQQEKNNPPQKDATSQ